MTRFERARISLANPSRSSQAEIERLWYYLGLPCFWPKFLVGHKKFAPDLLISLGNNIYATLSLSHKCRRGPGEWV